MLFDAVAEAMRWACVTDGIFDPTLIDAKLEAAGYDRTFDEIAGARAPCAAGRLTTRRRWRGTRLTMGNGRITMPVGVRIDLGWHRQG